MMINLLPPEKRKRHLPIKRILALVSSLFVILWVGIYFFMLIQAAMTQDNILSAKEKYQLMSKSIERKEAAEKQEQIINKKNAVLAGISKTTNSEYAVLVHLSDLLTDNVWLTEIDMDEKKGIIIKGNAKTFPHLATFLNGFENNNLFSEVTLVRSGVGKVANQEVTEFEVTAKFKEL